MDLPHSPFWACEHNSWHIRSMSYTKCGEHTSGWQSDTQAKSDRHQIARGGYPIIDKEGLYVREISLGSVKSVWGRRGPWNTGLNAALRRQCCRERAGA